MAEEALKKVEEQLICSICLDTYTDPKLLQCFHTYCQQCLAPLVDRDQQGQLNLTCPTCRQVTPIPSRGTAGLQPAFHINHLLEIRESLQKPENPAASAERAAEGGAPTDLNPTCSIHEGKDLELYCDTCGELICWKCALKGGSHHNHSYEELDPAFKKYKEEITPYLEPLEKQVTAMEGALACLNLRCNEISDQRAATEDTIHVSFRRLQDVLDAKKTRLIGRLHKITQGKLKGLAAQRDQIETSLAQLNSCLQFTRESLRKGNKEGDVLSIKSKTLMKVKALATPVKPDILEPNAKADIVFSVSADVIALRQNYGQVYSPGLPDPSQCRAIGEGTQVAVVGEKSTAVLRAVNCVGAPCSEPITTWECELVSQITGTRVKCCVEKREGLYEISYQPAIKGRHQLHITVEGENIGGSPFSVSVTSPVKNLGRPIQTVDVGRPWGVAINRQGEVVVTEKDKQCVSIFSPACKLIRSFSTRLNFAMGHLGGPGGLAVDGEGNILVADSLKYYVFKFTAEGQILAEGQFLTSGGEKQFPSLTVNPTNNMVYKVDGTNHCVKVLNPDLTFSSSFGKRGSAKGQFNEPCGIACDSTGNVYVADSFNHRIQVFSAKGKFLRMFGKRGLGRGELDGPSYIAIDSSDMVYVSEGENHRVSVFTSEG